MKNIIVVSALCLSVSGCASIVSGTTQGVRLQSTQGATYTVKDRNGAQIATGSTPAEVNLPRGYGYFKTANYAINFNKPGYTSKNIDIVPDFNGWYLGNLLLPGGLWWMLIVDPSTGAMYKLNPTDVEVALEPNGDPLDENGNLLKPPSSNYGKIKISKFDYDAQQVAKAQNCQIFGNGDLSKSNDGDDLIKYLCRDRRTIETQCSSRNGCTLKQ